MRSIVELGYEDLAAYIQEKGWPRFRTKQLVSWLYQKGVNSYEDMTNIPKAMRDTLSQEMPYVPAVITDKQVSVDGTRKYIVQFFDGASAEMVAIPAQDRLTVCFSTQVGCAMKCSFCATGKEGFTRNIHPGEIVEQVMIAQRDMGMRVSNLVGMGQGEPFLNYDAVLKGLRFLNAPDGLNIAARHIAVSTCGVFDGIERFGVEPEQFTLAISLHSAVQATRDELMPKMKNQPLKDLKSVVRRYISDSGRRVTFEYLLIRGVNDDAQHLEALVAFCKGLLCHVNFINLNNVEGSPLKPADPSTVRHWLKECACCGIEATVRESRGKDIDGACGQLMNKVAKH